MNIYQKIIKYLQERTNGENANIVLNELVGELGLPFDEFINIMNELQEEKIIKYDCQVSTSGLEPTQYIIGVFRDIKRVSFGENFIYKIEARLTFKGSEYQVE
jgi:hypothetical protein